LAFILHSSFFILKHVTPLHLDLHSSFFILHFSFFKQVCPLNLNLNMFMKVYEGLVFGSSWQRSNQKLQDHAGSGFKTKTKNIHHKSHPAAP
jgi:hypothetical protein